MNQAQAVWRQQLAQVADGEAWVRARQDHMRDLGLVLDDEVVMTVAEPVFVTDEQVRRDREVVAAVLASLRAAGEAVTVDPGLRAQYAGHWWESMPDAELLALPSGYSQPFVFGRLDGLRTPEGLRFLEFNGGLPGGLSSSDLAPAVLAQTEVAQRFGEQIPFRLFDAGGEVIDALVSTWHDFGGSGLPFVVLAVPDELVAMVQPRVAHLLEIAAVKGIEMPMVDPGRLAFSEGRLRLDGRAVDVVVRGFFTPMFAYLGERLDGLLAALRAESVCMVTSLQSGLFGLKSLFAMITDPAVDLDVPAHMRAAALQALPWTRIVQPGATHDPDGASVDMAQFLQADRENLVIKPVEGYGGAGVELGWQHSSDSWQQVVDKAMAGGHIAQRRVEVVEQELARLEPGFPVAPFTGDQNPLICYGELAGYFVRLAAPGGGLTNVSSGDGTVAPVFIID